MNDFVGFRRILVPLDGSSLAEAVLPTVTHLARGFGATICLLHIVEAHAPQAVHGDPHLTSAAAADAYLAGVARRLGPGLPVERHVHAVEEHDVAHSIALHVDELAVDLVALCVHGPGSLRRTVQGSIGQQVRRRAQVPVLVARAGAPPPAQIGLLLVPLDGTADGAAAIPVAAAVARACGAGLHLVRVVATVETLSGDRVAEGRLAPLATAATLDAEAEQAAAGLAGPVAALAAAGLVARASVVRGGTVRSLATAITQTGPDLVVLATHGRAGLGAVWMGSVAAELLGRIAPPLLLVRL